MEGYTKLFVVLGFVAVILSILNPVINGDATLEETRKGHHAHTHHKGYLYHHHHHHHHHHQHHNHKTKKGYHHRKNKKFDHAAPKEEEYQETSHTGNHSQNYTIIEEPKAVATATTTPTTSRSLRNRRQKESKSYPSMEISCTSTNDCTNITNSLCDSVRKLCYCDHQLPVFIESLPACIRAATLNATCEYDEQCAGGEEFSTCDRTKKICVCIAGYEMKEYPLVGVNCVTKSNKSGGSNVDPAMIGVLAGLALMFVIICVVLRLFSKARFRENRSIFNTPNPRLMNASLFKDSKLLSPARGDRRGSRASMRGPPSRAPSITSVNKDGAGRSPNGSLAKGRRGSTLSTASATGSAAAAAPPSAKTPSPTTEKKQTEETAVAIEAVD